MDHFAFPSETQLDALFLRHFGAPAGHGWRIRLWHRFGYHKPDLWYQAVVDGLITPGCAWIDVGGGKSILPHNHALSVELVRRCGHLVGVDPSETIHHNELVDEKVQSSIEDYRAGRSFDIATLRMVAEHVEHPERVVEALARCVKPGGHVVVFTPNRWSVLSILATLIPDRLHAVCARWLSPGRKDEDVFPTRYRMNSRRQLRRWFEAGGFQEVDFRVLDDVIVFHRFRITCFLELSLWRLFRCFRLPYPESNLLGVYRRSPRGQVETAISSEPLSRDSCA